MKKLIGWYFWQAPASVKLFQFTWNFVQTYIRYCWSNPCPESSQFKTVFDLLSNGCCSRFGGKWKIEKNLFLKNQWRTKVFRTRYFSQTYYLIIGSIKTKNCNCLCVLELKIHEKDPFVCGIWPKFIYYSKYNLAIKITLK